ncbi:hypothetical protein Q1X24_16345 [Enterococcus sp. B1E4]|uniref:hypothetical protein n=1 Tax=unclassified Enterococcus TaxID=2608891 RepID=UPI00265C6AE3|nr:MULTISPECIES: hypothetical protein [unclassified Enterococcus]MDO0896422.1 hypothetical protein [Enterococcus sp. B1E4]MDO0909188.1 hypothetical protein [Enterococcus sp. B2E4]
MLPAINQGFLPILNYKNNLHKEDDCINIFEVDSMVLFLCRKNLDLLPFTNLLKGLILWL